VAKKSKEQKAVRKIEKAVEKAVRKGIPERTVAQAVTKAIGKGSERTKSADRDMKAPKTSFAKNKSKTRKKHGIDADS
jgi:hypothetical protein